MTKIINLIRLKKNLMYIYIFLINTTTIQTKSFIFLTKIFDNFQLQLTNKTHDLGTEIEEESLPACS